MKIVITPEENIDHESQHIHQMFERGLKHLHIRKPHFSREEMKAYLQNISPQYADCLVLHQHHTLAEEFGIYRLHFSETKRKKCPIHQADTRLRYSTSVHSIEDFNTLETKWAYAFISPIFPSISKKGYGEQSTLLLQLSARTNTQVKMIALGGITPENQHLPLQYGADGVAFLGAIWKKNSVNYPSF